MGGNGGHDARIGFSFLFPGVGYGGSCFPKDVRALESTARAAGIDPLILTAIDAVNSRQKTVLIDRIIDELREIRGALIVDAFLTPD